MDHLQPAQCPSLAADEIHLWCASIAELQTRMQAGDLSIAEQEKADAVVKKSVREQFLASRWLTRHVLAKYLGQSLRELRFGLSSAGKPFLLDAGEAWEFSRSHSGGWIVLGVSRAGAVGVDIEKISARVQMRGIVQRWFLPEERLRFQNLSEDAQLAFFHECWVEKEAVLKAWGVGLVELSGFADYASRSWSCRFDPAPGMVGCVAHASSTKKKLHFFAA